MGNEVSIGAAPPLEDNTIVLEDNQISMLFSITDSDAGEFNVATYGHSDDPFLNLMVAGVVSLVFSSDPEVQTMILERGQEMIAQQQTTTEVPSTLQ